MTDAEQLKQLALEQKVKIAALQKSVDTLQDKQDKAFAWFKEKIESGNGATSDELKEAKAIFSENDAAIDAATADVNATVIPETETEAPAPDPAPEAPAAEVPAGN